MRVLPWSPSAGPTALAVGGRQQLAPRARPRLHRPYLAAFRRRSVLHHQVRPFRLHTDQLAIGHARLWHPNDRPGNHQCSRLHKVTLAGPVACRASVAQPRRRRHSSRQQSAQLEVSRALHTAYVRKQFFFEKRTADSTTKCIMGSVAVCGWPIRCNGSERRNLIRCESGRVSGLFDAAIYRWPRWVPRSTPKRIGDLVGRQATRVLWLIGSTDQHLVLSALIPATPRAVQATCGVARR
jgi:hypothetical protein